MDKSRKIPKKMSVQRTIGVNRAAKLVFGEAIYDVDPAKRGFLLTHFLCHTDRVNGNGRRRVEEANVAKVFLAMRSTSLVTLCMGRCTTIS